MNVLLAAMCITVNTTVLICLEAITVRVVKVFNSVPIEEPAMVS